VAGAGGATFDGSRMARRRTKMLAGRKIRLSVEIAIAVVRV
jgi:hypothetical protein